ncbi:type IV pilus modification protein PilV [Endozoicomonas ascidiicola]|uniref:type IV pilus modification protein PilV n=1 Tax=Endozoicomonas ascidiicola TaxID=1698521 RepID=UPI0008337ADD|nr:type IV pilus modification protein PilV [Endozoicomonas ascidiicola]
MKNTSGFTMIEVLVAMMIVSVGLLGIAGLVLESRKNIIEVQQRSIAINLADDLLARMAANVDGLGSYTANLNAVPAQPGTVCHQAGSNCTAQQTAAFDLWQWGTSVFAGAIQREDATSTGGLISPRACININNSDVTLTLVWRGRFPRPDSRPPDALVPAEPGNCGTGIASYRSIADNDLRRVMVMNTTIN